VYEIDVVAPVRALAEDLRSFGKAGGFRRNVGGPPPPRLLELRTVRARADLEHLETREAARCVVADVIAAYLEERLGDALRAFLQVDKPTSWSARDLMTRRAQAGAKLTSPKKPQGISGRTWEREYEASACEELSAALLATDAALKRREEMARATPAARQWPLTLAVLPFRHSAHALDEELVEGFADDIVGRLARVAGLDVISTTTSRGWLLEPDPLAAARDKAGVHLVITGTIRKLGDALHVTTRLEETTTHATQWAADFEFEVADLLAAQSRVADAVVEVLNPPHGGGTLALRGGDTGDSEAYELYVRGRALAARNSEADVDVALDLLKRALAIDGSFANAHASLGYALWRQYFSGWAGTEALDEALGAVQCALQLDPQSAEARLTKIRIFWDIGWHEEALHEGQIAVTANAQSRVGRLAFARALNNAGLADLALPLTRSVLISEPREVTARKLLIWNLLMTGNAEEAVAEGRAYLALNRSDANTSWAVAGALLAQGRPEEAADICSQGLRADPTDVTLWLLKGYVLRIAGAAERAEQTWDEGAATVAARLRQVRENERVSAFLANIYAALGNAAAARDAVSRVEKSKPASGYLAYRCAAALAELRDVDGALTRLQAAIDNGFLSVQLLRFEEHFGLATLRRTLLYARRTEALERKVETLRAQYGPLVEVLTSRNGGSYGSEK
jgi:TolB-like protein/Flp pilus assembly protein TadD